MRKKVVAGNWKMHLDKEEAQKLTCEVLHMVESEVLLDIQVILSPSFTNLSTVHHLIKGNTKFALAAQNISEHPQGAFTGEVSAGMIKSVGCSHVILGHSERRQYFGDAEEVLAKKVDIALQNNLIPIFCVGETLEQRERNETFDVIRKQVEGGLFHLEAEPVKNILIAYEPVWAIGTGKTASSAQAEEVHAFIRDFIGKNFGSETADEIRILYGGSVKPDNANELFSQKNIDGGLIGGASLKSRDFTEIIKAAK